MSHPVIAGLRSASAAERREACRAAVADPSAVLLIDALVAALADDDASVVRAASAALERIGREHPAVLTALRGALRSPEPRQRLEAAWTWARLEPPPIKLLPAVVSALDSARRQARWRAARLLVELGRLHEEVLPVVANLARAEATPRERRIALSALRELAPHDAATLAAHLDASRSDDPGLARFAFTSLAGLGARSPEVWERVAEALGDADPALRRVAVLAATALGSPPPPARSALERAAAQDADPSVRAAAERALPYLRNG